MPKIHFRSFCSILFASTACALVLPGCASHSEDTGTETHWLKKCDEDADCNGPTSCLCGVCTIECDADNSCPDQAPQCLESSANSCGGGSESICLKEPLVSSEDGGSGGPSTESDSSAPFEWDSYTEMLCRLYSTCSPVVRSAYGTAEQCLAYTRDVYEASRLKVPSFSEPIWDKECLVGLRRLDCPEGEVSIDSLTQHISVALQACGNPEVMGCNDRADCFDLWECSATDGSCGSCQRPAAGTCSTTADCSGSDHCVDGVCGPGKPDGTACGASYECESNRCSEVCVATQPEGGNCATSYDCDDFLWCNQGVCSLLLAAGEACVKPEDNDMICQLGYGCEESRCQEIPFTGIAVGERCSYSGNCVAGAECVDFVCTPSELACADDNQCPQENYCGAECVARLADGADCSRDAMCLSGYCSESGVCTDPNPCD